MAWSWMNVCVVSRDIKKKQKQGSSEHPEEDEKKEEIQNSSATSPKCGGAAQPLKRGQKVTMHHSWISIFRNMLNYVSGTL